MAGSYINASATNAFSTPVSVKDLMKQSLINCLGLSLKTAGGGWGAVVMKFY